ncbi:MAG: hypothetical protein IJR63_02635 [Synergistaceae bacterium]|nr:hypothetical protein [Synergistaceae bacterium]
MSKLCTICRKSLLPVAGLVETVLESRNWSEPGSLDEAIALVDEGRREALRLAGS